MTGDVELTYYDVFTNQNVSYAENLDALEAGETYEKTINTTNVYKVTMNITDPGVLVNHVPSG